MTRRSFLKKFGFEPEWFWVWLASVGDSVDGVKGVRRYGPKAFERDVRQVGIEGILDKFGDNEEFLQAKDVVKLPNWELFGEDVKYRVQNWVKRMLLYDKPSCERIAALAKSLYVSLEEFGGLCV